MKPIVAVAGMLGASNLIMTIAWYWHLKPGASGHMPLWQMVVVSWLIAFFEYCVVVPANHFGAQWGLTPFQLKIIQEAVALVVFTLFAVAYLRAELSMNYAYSFLCLMGAVYFAFR